MHFLYVIQI